MILLCSIHSHVKMHGKDKHETVFLEEEITDQVKKRIFDVIGRQRQKLDKVKSKLVSEAKEKIREIKLNAIGIMRKIANMEKMFIDMAEYTACTDVIFLVGPKDSKIEAIQGFANSSRFFPDSWMINEQEFAISHQIKLNLQKIEAGALLQSLKPFQIFIKNQSKTLVLEVMAEYLVSDLKEEIYRCIGYPKNQQKLFLNKLRLVDSHTISSYGIGKNSTIEVLV